MSLTLSGALDELTGMSEGDLQAKVIEPLLRAMGFRNVRDTSGPTEHGKDLVAVLPDAFGVSQLYAVQIKRTRLAAAVTRSDSLSRILDQLRQALESEIVDPATGAKRRPDFCIFITPFEVPERARQAFQRRFYNAAREGVRIIDGPSILDLLSVHLPEAISAFSLDVQYRMRVANRARHVPESMVAFDLVTPLDLHDIWVDAVAQRGDSPLAILSAGLKWPPQSVALPKPRRGVKKSVIRTGENDSIAVPPVIADLHSMCTIWTGQRLGVAELPRPAKERLENERFVHEDGRRSKLDEEEQLWALDIQAVLDAAAVKAREQLEELEVLGSPDISADDATKVVGTYVAEERRAKEVLGHALVRACWPALGAPVVRKTAEGSAAISFTATEVLKIRHPLLIEGAPGGGKTTLMRRLTWEMATSDGPDPLFVQLLDLTDHTLDGLLNLFGEVLDTHGWHSRGSGERKRIVDLLAGGRFRVLLDGLDELGRHAEAALAAIVELQERFPSSHVALTKRDTFPVSDWDAALKITLMPFSDLRLERFVTKWFESQPTARATVLAWLRDNRPIREAARTPIVAALLCSLHEAGAELPEREFELYERRVELLLGKWEQAKQIQPLPSQVRGLYWRYLMQLAVESHCRQLRHSEEAKCLEVAERYFSKVHHQSAAGLLNDCQRRGLLQRERDGACSFGHLTYQEHLVAKWLDMENPTRAVFALTADPWWSKVLLFYAGMRMDIGSLLDEARKWALPDQVREQLVRMSAVAPLTAARRVRRIEDGGGTITFSFSNPPDAYRLPPMVGVTLAERPEWDFDVPQSDR